MSGVSDYAHDFKRAVFRFLRMINNDVLTKCISSVKEFFYESFVHHHDRHPFSTVAGIESASGQERNTHRAKVISQHGEMRRIRMIAQAGIWSSCDPEGGGAIVTGKR